VLFARQGLTGATGGPSPEDTDDATAER